MSILSNKGRVIPSLDNYASPAGGDLLIVQDMARNQTRNITFSQVSTILATLLQGTPVNFTNANNKFTGSFKGGFANFLDGKFSVKDAVFSASGFPTIKLGTSGATSTITLNTSNITLNTPTVVVGQLLTVGGLLTASGGVAGNLTGNVTGNLTGNVTGYVNGDIYDDAHTQKILDNRTNRTALFRGSGSYASRSLSSSHALVADVTYTCLSHTTTADFATSARSASYASQSRSSSYLRYTGIPNGSSSYALKSGYALSAKTVVDIPDRALTASYLLWNATVGKNNGSASFAHTASYARTASYVSSGINVSGLGGLPSNVYQYSESPSQLSTYVASSPYYYEISHGFGSKPSLIRITALCTIVETTLGYIVGDEIDISNLQILDDNWDRVKSITWSNLTKVGISFNADTHCIYIPYKSGNNSDCMTTANWKIVIRTWK